MPVNIAGRINNIAASNENIRNQHANRRNAQQDRAAAHYTRFRNHLLDGAKRVSDAIAQSPNGIQFGDETRKMMFTAAQQADVLAKRQGLVADNVMLLEQAFQTKPGVVQAQNRGTISAAETVANAQAELSGGLPTIQGASAGSQNAAQLRTELAQNVPQLEGQQAALTQNAQVAATDQGALGSAEAEREMASRRATADYLIRRQGLDPTSPEAQQIADQIFSGDKQRVDLTKAAIAATQSGLIDFTRQGQAAPADVFAEFTRILKEMSVSDDLFGQILQNLGGSPAAASASVPSINPAPGGVSEADIQATMRKHNMTREQVLERLAADGQ